jgi:hypothetical protein
MAIDLAEALESSFDCDAHFCAYEPTDPPVRLAGDPAVIPGGVRMVVLIGDLDDPVAHATKTPARDEWRAEQLDRIEASGLACYETRGGYRVLATLDEPFVLTTLAHAEEWKARYEAWCDELEQSCGLELDRACKDWTRLYRLPNVERDGETQEAEVLGSLPVVTLPAVTNRAAKPKARNPRDTEDARTARAHAVAAALPPSVEGHGGDEALFKAASELATVLGGEAEAIEAVLTETFNPRCVPPWPATKLAYESKRAADRWASPEARFSRSREAAAAERTEGAGPFAPPPSDPDMPLFLCSRNGCVTLMWEGDATGHRPIHEKRIRLRARELGYDRGMLELYAKGGKPVSTDALLEKHSKSYEHTAYAFANTVTQYDPTGTGRVLIGYPKPAIEATYDAQVDAWLRALGGTQYERLAVWIASCSQENINRLSACLILIGEKNIGKSMLGLAVARMWGEDPPPLELISVTFNADMQRCPILVDEEAQLFGSKALSTKKFREVIQTRHRSIELKGKERCQLYGGLRAVVSCNGYSDLRFSDLGGPAVVAALRDRMCIIDALGRSAAVAAQLEPLKDAIGLVDLERIARHMAWLCVNITLPAERFLGAGGDSSEGAVLAGHIEEHVDLWEGFRDWLESESPAGPWYASERHGLCVDTAALAMSLENTGRGWDHRQVREALAPFHTGDTRLRLDNARLRVWCVDARRIAEAMQLDAETLALLEARLAGAPQERASNGRFGRARG